MIKSQLNDRAHYSRSAYEKINGQCLSRIPKGYKKAKGIDVFHVPGEGDQAISKVLVPAFSDSKQITMAAHLFGYSNLFLRGLSCAAKNRPSSDCFKKRGRVPAFKKGIGGADVRLMTDDDIHWMRVGQTGDNGKVGFNSPWEARDVAKAEKAGVQVRYMETSHHDSYIQIHHNKIILFEGGKNQGVWTGAGNFTKNAMHTNFENYFFITIPSVVAAYSEQLEYQWDNMSTPYENMPKIDSKPLSKEE